MKDDKNDKSEDSTRAEGDVPTGKARGGFARKDALSPERRAEIATQAAAARWAAARPPKATHKGNFNDDFGIDVDCYVLSDEQKTAVISQRGMGAALNPSATSGAWIRQFVEGEKIAPFVGSELRGKLKNPIVFQWTPPVSTMGPPAVVHGYDATILIDICKAVIEADDEGKLLARQKNVAKQARIIISASAKAGIKGLVYALAGYDQTKEEAIAAFKFFVREEAREYEKEFPTKLYEEWYRLYGLPKPTRGKSWKFRHLTVEQVYRPLAQSNGKILELTRAQKANSPDRYAKLHQFLSEIGVKALRTHLGRLLGMAEVSTSRAQYEKFVEKIFGKQLGLDFERKT